MHTSTPCTTSRFAYKRHLGLQLLALRITNLIHYGPVPTELVICWRRYVIKYTTILRLHIYLQITFDKMWPGAASTYSLVYN